MTIAKLIKEDEEGLTLLINRKEYEEYIQVLTKWIEENPDAKIEESEKKIKKIILQD
jgi:hypothetical protein